MRLQLTRRTDYAIRACMFLASNRPAGPASSRRIADRMQIPERFLPHVLADLTKAGIVEARIGRRGGYRLRRPADRLTILELVEKVEGADRGDRCVLVERACERGLRCAFHPVWTQAQSALIEVLAGATVANLLPVVPGAFDPTSANAQPSIEREPS